jgi:CheY-like chemotaxis protein
MACIVVADDDTEIADFITYSFQTAGHTVYTVLDGVQALDLIRTHLPDLVVLDQLMPGLTGLQVAATLRADARTAQLPILMITASRMSEPNPLVDRLVTKPLRPRQLATIMTDMLARPTHDSR